MEADADARAYDALSKHPRLGDLAALTRSLMKTPPRADGRTPGGARRRARDGPRASPARRPRRPSATRSTCSSAARRTTPSAPWPAPSQRTSSRTTRPRDRTTKTGSRRPALAGDAHAVRCHGIARPGPRRRARRTSGTPWPTASGGPIRRQAPAGLGRGEALVGAAALAASPARKAPFGRPRRWPARFATASSPACSPRGSRASRRSAAAGRAVHRRRAARSRPRCWPSRACSSLVAAARAVGRLALDYRRPAEVSLTDDGGVRVKTGAPSCSGARCGTVTCSYLARPCRARRARCATPRLAMYAGLLALAVGSYLGVATFVDGVRAASPSLLGSGLAIVALGLGLGLRPHQPRARLSVGAAASCFVPARRHPQLCVGERRPRRADAVLARLARP